jgi:succinate dehydrogenase / fumarate reductase membrane anchor subunit
MAAPARPSARAPRTRPGFEAWSWLFMRLSGLALVFLALLHFAITHVLNDVVETDYRFVANRWDNPLWQIFDWLLLALALLHGANGARWVVEDYVRKSRPQTTAKYTVYALTAALLVYGTVTIVTFSPAST